METNVASAAVAALPHSEEQQPQYRTPPSNIEAEQLTVRADQDIYNLGDNALDSFAGTTYNKPPGLSCNNNFIIF